MRPPVLVTLFARFCATPPAISAQCSAASGERRVALLEFYTSEGCDSCPPADRWISGLPVGGFGPDRLVVLGFHVDYWNHLGWPDPFAQRKFTDRQQAAAARNRARFVYTPQLLLDGRDFRRGTVREDIAGRIDTINQRAAGAAFRVELGKGPAGTEGAVHDAYLALYENNLSNRVTRGENRSKRLQHDFVVRELAGPFRVSAGESAKFSHVFQLERSWKSRDLHVAGFVQSGGSGACPALLRLGLLLVQTTLCRNVLRQKFHLIGENAAIGENQVFRAVRHIWQIDQFHPGPFRRAVALLLVA